jgi:hypothetical protein
MVAGRKAAPAKKNTLFGDDDDDDDFMKNSKPKPVRPSFKQKPTQRKKTVVFGDNDSDSDDFKKKSPEAPKGLPKLPGVKPGLPVKKEMPKPVPPPALPVPQ